MEFFFEDHLRLDWGLGNPNKTAALIACLLVVVHLFRLLKPRRLGLIFFAVSFAGLGICLIHTYSRGGMVAAIAGQLAFWFYHRRARFKMPLLADLLTAIALILFLGIYASLPQVNATSRYALGVVPGATEDLSISNRIRIWKDAPRMMVDAPGGWGKDQAGIGWMQWYQPFETRYQYRTLVNSHLTYLVEWGWIGRFVYLLAWLLLLVVLFYRFGDSAQEASVSAMTGGVWCAFAIAAVFSTVAESGILWILPIATLIISIVLVWIRHRAGSRSRWIRASKIAILAALAFCSVLFVWGYLDGKSSHTRIAVRQGVIQVGGGQPKYLLIEPDRTVVGRHYGYVVRENSEEGWLVIPKWDGEEISNRPEIVILSGKIEPRLLKSRPTVILNPVNLFENWNRQKSTFQIFIGSLRKDPVATALKSTAFKDGAYSETYISVPGKKKYLGDWVSLLKQHFAETNP